MMRNSTAVGCRVKWRHWHSLKETTPKAVNNRCLTISIDCIDWCRLYADRTCVWSLVLALLTLMIRAITFFFYLETHKFDLKNQITISRNQNIVTFCPDPNILMHCLIRKLKKIDLKTKIWTYIDPNNQNLDIYWPEKPKFGHILTLITTIWTIFYLKNWKFPPDKPKFGPDLT